MAAIFNANSNTTSRQDMAEMKVFGGLCFRGARQVRTIIAATSATKAAAAVHETPHHFRGYWSVTGNSAELIAALSNPGQVFQARDSLGKDFKPAVRVNGSWVDA